jgi:hypothetical protein
MDCPNESGNDKMSVHESPLGAEAPTPWWQSGKVVIVFIALGLAIASYFYAKTVPPTWLHDFGADIALRAVADPNATEPEDSREASPRGLTDNPLICATRLIPQPWERIVFVTHEQGKTLNQHPVLGKAQWVDNSIGSLQSQLMADDRYQLVVLMNGDQVRDAQMFFTFWADLSGLARPEGFTPDEAIFTAASLQGRYVLSVAPNVTKADCPK